MFWRTNQNTMLLRRDHSSSLVSTLASGTSSSSFYLHDPATTVDSRGRRSASATAALSDLFGAGGSNPSHAYPESSLPLPPEPTAAASGNAITISNQGLTQSR